MTNSPTPRSVSASAADSTSTATSRTVRVGILGTSWWADSMYLPALAAHPDAEIVGVCGRTPAKAEQLAAEWDIDWWSVDSDDFIDPRRLDAVIIATSNDSHESLALLAMERGLHVLCEKPIATSTAAATAMARAASELGAITLVPFTYRYMPTHQYVKRLIDEGFVGRPFHLNMRYFTGFARAPEGGGPAEYSWRFDTELAGSGVLGDLGSHWLHVARWLLGEVTEIGCISSRFVDREPRPDGSDYERSEDSAQMTVRFGTGAYATLQVSAVCWEGTDFNQTHHLDLHGTDGTIYAYNDWSTVQEVRGLRANEPGPAAVMEIPDDVWGDARRDRVHDTYRDVFRVDRRMIGDWIDAVRDGRPVAGPLTPDLAEGARVQQLLELAARSAAGDGRLLDART
ncbi:MAG: Gfo/Idh/MocA family oxidoreductase [Ilumatobacter sp.]|uniref:Gfo/Idh/MocA family protein n=1 Tax=Ilumatobacter sp. TaxID=1967498 RepID=UPI003C77E905